MNANAVVREVDGADEDVAEDLFSLHQITFRGVEVPDFEQGHWWLAYHDFKTPVGFAGIVKVPHENLGYLKRAGVIPSFRGQGLQRRFIRVREIRARKNGWARVVTDTTSNVASANSLIGAGYRLYSPAHPWAFNNSLYWYKDL